MEQLTVDTARPRLDEPPQMFNLPTELTLNILSYFSESITVGMRILERLLHSALCTIYHTRSMSPYLYPTPNNDVERA